MNQTFTLKPVSSEMLELAIDRVFTKTPLLARYSRSLWMDGLQQLSKDEAISYQAKAWCLNARAMCILSLLIVSVSFRAVLTTQTYPYRHISIDKSALNTALAAMAFLGLYVLPAAIMASDSMAFIVASSGINIKMSSLPAALTYLLPPFMLIWIKIWWDDDRRKASLPCKLFCILVDMVIFQACVLLSMVLGWGSSTATKAT
ncbi:uncharacterized protein BDV14DRAFT_102954 [Aspergillus stella-maris]|uniref:uncharacterized protein n=1 Tax=Aspergillus stella-maris TaxID=1810926 RepID=UPI003CCDF7A6